MTKLKVKPSKLSGNITSPPSKSHTMRAILLASLASGQSVIKNVLESPDMNAMIKACTSFGAQINHNGSQLIIEGVAGKPKAFDETVDCGNSGQVLRFITAVAGLIDGTTLITGDESICTNRPMGPVLEGLTQLGASAKSVNGNGFAPIMIQGSIITGEIYIDGFHSQPVSAFLMMSAFLNGTTKIHVKNVNEKAWIDLTLSWLDRLGVQYENNDHKYYKVYGKVTYPGFEYTVPGDFSSAAYPIAAALISNSEITICNLDMDDIQGDKKLISILESMGANFQYDKANQQLHVLPSKELKGRLIDINDFSDAVTILAVIGCFAKGTTELIGASSSRAKESNRIKTMCTELSKLGADIKETKDGLIVKQSALSNTVVTSYKDHRVAMSLAVAGIGTKNGLIVEDTNCIKKSFPNFAGAMNELGMAVR